MHAVFICSCCPLRQTVAGFGKGPHVQFCPLVGVSLDPAARIDMQQVERSTMLQQLAATLRHFLLTMSISHTCQVRIAIGAWCAG